ncbi:MAG: hypothetical protein AAF719_04955 [Pseudomonadota bacterium]
MALGQIEYSPLAEAAISTSALDQSDILRLKRQLEIYIDKFGAAEAALSPLSLPDRSFYVARANATLGRKMRLLWEQAGIDIIVWHVDVFEFDEAIDFEDF